jgi:hypothetical protein
MTGHVCSQCGAGYEAADDSCESRFDALLALDHSRREPWGSRHGSTFSAFTLQHPRGRPREALEQCWTLLYRIWIGGDDPQAVAQGLRRVNAGEEVSWTVPPLPADAGAPRRFSVTIADLGDFDADRFAPMLEAWCRATLEAFGQPSP